MIKELIFADVTEHDTDLAIIRSFLDYYSVRELFFSQINKKGQPVKVFHSLSQMESDGHQGESDIVIICENEKERFALFIEDKIAADPQPSQRNRYDDRAMLLRDSEQYKDFFVFLCAPKAYLGTAKADGYDKTVSHEEICELLDDGDMNKFIFDFSCNEKKQGYNPIKNDAVTEFWLNLYRFVSEEYPQLKINKITTPRGSNASWPAFKTSVKGLRIVWKSDLKRNSVDLEFAGLAKDPDRFNDIIKMVGATNYEPAVTTGSMSLTVKFPESENVSFNRPFNDQIENIRKFLDVAVEFDNLSNKIFYEGITDLTK